MNITWSWTGALIGFALFWVGYIGVNYYINRANWNIWQYHKKGEHRFHAIYHRGGYHTHAKEIYLKLEVPVGRKVTPGFRFHFGDRGSETPLDIMVSFYWIAFFFSFQYPGLGALFEKIGRGHKRDISLTFHGGSMWWQLWFDDDGGYDQHHKCDPWRKPIWPWSMGRKKYRPWMCLRNGHIDLNPLDAIYGSRMYTYTDLERKTKLLRVNQFPGDEYEVRFTLQEVHRGRKYGPAWARQHRLDGYTVAWCYEEGEGIPIRNHAWKGDGIIASAERVDSPANWFTKAKVSLIKRIEADRIKYNYQPPKQKSAVDLALEDIFKTTPLSELELHDLETWANMNNGKKPNNG